MAGELLTALNVVLSIGDAVTPTEGFTVVPGVIGLPTFPALVPPEIDVTALDSTGAEYILGLGDPGTLEFNINVRKPASGAGYIAGQANVVGFAGDNILRGYKIVVKNGATVLYTLTGKCFVKSFQEQAPSANAAITAKVVLRCSGAITRA